MSWRQGKAYGQDLRDRVFTAFDAGAPVVEVAETLFVSTSYVSRALLRRERTGETAARAQCGHVPPKLEPLYEAIRERVASFPDATLEELRTWLLETDDVEASTTLVWETLAKFNLTFKKRPFTPPNKTAPMSSWSGEAGGGSGGRRS